MNIILKTHFIEQLQNNNLDTGNLFVSFDVVSLFTRSPIEDTLKLLRKHFSLGITKLYKHILTTPYFQFDGNSMSKLMV